MGYLNLNFELESVWRCNGRFVFRPVRNAAARLILGLSRQPRITAVLQRLRWIQIKFLIMFTLTMIVHSIFRTVTTSSHFAPTSLSDVNDGYRQPDPLLSAEQESSSTDMLCISVVPVHMHGTLPPYDRTCAVHRTSFRDRSFSVAGPRLYCIVLYCRCDWGRADANIRITDN